MAMLNVKQVNKQGQISIGKKYAGKRALSKMDFDQVRSSSGLNLEQIKKTKTRKGNPI